MSSTTDEAIQQFMALTNGSHEQASQYLEQYDGDLNEAVNAFFMASSNPTPPANELPHVERDVSERSNPLFGGARETSRESTPGSNSGSANKDNKFMSFSDMVREQADEDDEDETHRNTFAGGETSGLEVTDPNRNDNNNANSLIKDLLEKARRGGERLAKGGDMDDEEEENKHHFIGKGYRLGSTVDTPSQVVEDNSERSESKGKGRVSREITFWKEGFQVGDGPLFRYDDPANSFYLKELNQGRAPLQLLDVEFGQEVDVNVYKKLDESYKPSKRQLGGFHGSGQRLGSPIPGDSQRSSVEFTATENKSNTVSPVEHEKPKGNTSVQIRYASGKREVLRCNSTDKVQIIFDHVKANTQDTSRSFTLNHAFPVKPIQDLNSTLQEADLVNAVVVQRWV